MDFVFNVVPIGYHETLTHKVGIYACSLIQRQKILVDDFHIMLPNASALFKINIFYFWIRELKEHPISCLWGGSSILYVRASLFSYHNQNYLCDLQSAFQYYCLKDALLKSLTTVQNHYVFVIN